MYRRTLIFLFSMILVLCWNTASNAEEREMPFKEGSIYLTPTVGVTFFFAEGNGLDVAPSPIMGGRAGYFFTEHISLEGSFEYLFSAISGPGATRTVGGSQISASHANIYLPMANLLYHFNPIWTDGLTPFVLAGAGVDVFTWAGDWKVGAGLQFGGGLNYSLNEYMSIRGELRNLYTTNPGTIDLVLNFGFSLHLFGKGEAALPPPPPPPPIPDSDNDGVPDHLDQCPGTAPGAEVDDVGCPFLSDAGTLYEIPLSGVLMRGIVFNLNSYEIRKPSYPFLDEVAETIKAYPDAKVEISGYTDITGPDAFNMKLSQERADAVRNYLISKGVPASQLTAKGYGEAHPIASNATLDGRRMNRRIEFHLLTPVDMTQVREGNNLYQLSKHGIIISGIIFKINSAQIKSSSDPALNEVAKTLRAFPTIVVEIAGYTDTTGTAEFNMNLSQKRAEAVKAFLIKRGVKPGQVQAKGYGEASPIASNETEAGREKNRRIEIKVLSE